MDYEQEYNASLEQAKKELKTCGTLDCDAAKLIFRLFPQLRKEEKPLTPFQQCLNCILRGVYYAEIPNEKVNEFILNVVRTRTDELIKLAKKQEEQKHPDGCFTCNEYKKGYEAGRLNGFTAGYNKAMKEVEQKEQKPGEDSEYRKAYLDGWNARNLQAAREQKPNIELIQRSWYMDGYIDGEFKREPRWNLKAGKGGPKYEENEKYGQPLEQNPAEWSEHDLTMIDNVLGTYKTLEDTLNLSTGQDRDILESMNFERDWLKSLPKRVSLKSEQEWSEEDEKMLNRIIETLSMPPIYDTKACAKMVSWLRSLRPSWKPSKEQIEALHEANIRACGTSYGLSLSELELELNAL